MAKRRQRGQRGLPWYRKARDQWCVTIDDKITPLVDGKGCSVRGKDNRVGAEKAWHEMAVMAAVPDNGADNEVRTILELYLQDLERRGVTAKTLTNYTGYFKSFVLRYPKLLVRDLRSSHVHDWWRASHPTWGNSSKNLSESAFKAAFRWAASPGKGGAVIPRNPLDGMPLPTMRKRSAEVVLNDTKFAALLGPIKSEPVREILLVAWETGTRPVNLARATKANLTDDGNALLYADLNTEPGSAVHKTFKLTGRPLVVPLTDLAREPAGVGQQVPLEARLAPVERARAGVGPPFTARALAESRTARSRFRSPRRPRAASRWAWALSHTPAAVHSPR